MFETIRARRGMVTASHHLAAEAGLSVLREGGNAIEAMIAAAATISVVYPHMNGIGGDGFWLISTPERRAPLAILGVGAAAADEDFYRAKGLDAVPARGPLAANTVAGTLSSWGAALEISADWGGTMALPRLLEDAIWHASEGFAVTNGQRRLTGAKRGELEDVPGWADLFLPAGSLPALAENFRQPALARTLVRLGEAGFDDFYRGELAKTIAADLARAGSPVGAGDLARHRASSPAALSVALKSGQVFNVPPPTQGLVSLIILGLFDRLGCAEAEGFAHLHGLIEATKRAIIIREREITDPAEMNADPSSFLTPSFLDALARDIDASQALPWPVEGKPGDTVWLGAVDSEGRAVSFIHSIYWEFGSGTVLRDTGIQWQNRGSSFSLDPGAPNHIHRGRLPFHTNNPAMALLADGRVMVYGSMGGEGQPQSQSAVYSRYAMFGLDLQAAIRAPRWLLGRTWGEPSIELRLEDRFAPELVAALRKAGHKVALQPAFTDLMGHAGAIVRHPSGLIEGANDPRSDGAAAGF
ncbi:MAG: gamma-glutamyltransferase family protein [Alphaproteobacteria bacterium]